MFRIAPRGTHKQLTNAACSRFNLDSRSVTEFRQGGWTLNNWDWLGRASHRSLHAAKAKAHRQSHSHSTHVLRLCTHSRLPSRWAGRWPAAEAGNSPRRLQFPVRLEAQPFIIHERTGPFQPPVSWSLKTTGAS